MNLAKYVVKWTNLEYYVISATRLITRNVWQTYTKKRILFHGSVQSAKSNC
jgi:hypothetical protein